MLVLPPLSPGACWPSLDGSRALPGGLLGAALLLLMWCGIGAGSQHFGQARLDWLAMIRAAQDQPLRRQLEQVNNRVNQLLLFADDAQVWGQADYWATPLEAIRRGAGDCEDFAIAKYVALIQLGLRPEQLRLIYVRAQRPMAGGGTQQQAHMVVGFYPQPNATPWVLDNLLAEVLPASQRSDLHPVFSFNSEGLWAGGRRAPSSPSARLSRWRGLLARMQQQGMSLERRVVPPLEQN